MSIGGRRARALGLVVVIGTAACTAAVPEPSARGRTTGPVASVAPPSPSESAAPSPTAPPQPPGSLADEIEIGTIDPALTPFISAFGSDGDAVYFGSGADAPADGEYAPDLWRYVPRSASPELVWRNPERNRTISVIAGDFGTIAFAEMDADGARDWKLWLIPEPDAEPILLDSHPGDEDVSSFLPSISVSEGGVAWTAFDRGAAGSVSSLLVAFAPDWTPVVLQERDAAVAELWLPSIRGFEVVYCEVRYNADRTRDERHVYLADVVAGSEPRRLDTSGLATMPIHVNDGVIWKETDPGFNMFNWGRLVFWSRMTDELREIPSRLQPDLNYPSAGDRFVAVIGYDPGVFQVYDIDRARWRTIGRYDLAAGDGVFRTHLDGSLLVWLESGGVWGDSGALRWAWLPPAGGDRLLKP